MTISSDEIAVGSIELRHISKRYQVTREKALLISSLLRPFRKTTDRMFWALRDVSFKVESGESIGIIGRNGAGKSTLLKLLTGVAKPTSGVILSHGRVGALLELGAGFHPELTGRENIFLNAAILGITRKVVKKQFESIVQFAEMEDFIDEPVKHYSSGMYARLGFAVAIGIDPDILVIDEVMAVGDASFTQKCLNQLSHLKEKGKTIVIVTHDLKNVEKWCGKAVYLERGIVKALGEPRWVVDTYLRDLSEQEDRSFEEKRAQAVPHSQDAHHWGTGEIRIAGVKLFKNNGQECYLFDVWNDICFEISFIADVPVRNISFGINVFSSSGVHCFGFSTYLDSYDIEEVEGTGRVRVILHRVPLTGGEYFVEAAVCQVCLGGNYIDLDYMSWKAKKFSFKIRPCRVDVGTFLLKRSWSFEGVRVSGGASGHYDGSN